MLSWVSDVAVYIGKQPGLSRPQIRITTISSLSMPSEVPSLRKLNPGRTGEPCKERLTISRTNPLNDIKKVNLQRENKLVQRTLLATVDTVNICDDVMIQVSLFSN